MRTDGRGRRKMSARFVALALLAGLVGFGASCQEASLIIPQMDGGNSPIPGLTDIQITPGSVSLIASDTPQQQQFRATGVYDDGHTQDVSDKVNWSVVSSGVANIGVIKGAGLFVTGAYGGEGKVYATSGTLTAQATIKVQLSRTVNDPSAGGGGPGQFGGAADPAAAPVVVYPYDQVLMPPNLGYLEVQWQKGAVSNTLYEVSFQNTYTDVKIYTGCKATAVAGCSYELPADLWNLLAQTNAGATTATAVTVRGTAGTGKPVGTSKPVQVFFWGEAVRGGIYYWSTEDSNSGNIYRIDLEKGVGEAYYTVAMAPLDHNGNRRCVGCHNISHDGKQLTLVLGGGGVSDLVQVAVDSKKPTLTQVMAGGFSNFQSYGPDGKRFIAALAGKMRLVDSTTGQNVVASILPAGVQGTHPSWSRSGKYLAYSQYSDDPRSKPGIGVQEYEQWISRGAVALLTWNGTSFSAPQILIAERSLQNSYYPSVGPDDKTLIFDRVSSCTNDNDCAAYDNPKAKIYITSVTGGGELALARLNQPGPTDKLSTGAAHVNLTNSWPKFSPFLQKGPRGQNVMWVTFSSKRAYGLQLANNNLDENLNKPQLWMAAIILDGEAGGDPSSPPFWIPRQPRTKGNHIAQWTEQIVPPLP